MCVCVYIYIYNYYTSFTCQGIIQFLHVSEPRLYISNKKKSRNQLAKSLITKHNSPKRTPTLWCRLDDPNKRISLQNHLLLLICSHERKFKIIIDTNHMEQNDNYARHTQTSHQLFNNSNQLCSKWSMPYILSLQLTIFFTHSLSPTLPWLTNSVNQLDGLILTCKE